ncbi:MAG TPA: DUF2079 domain-containing protein [Bacteroidia bacterium]|nr:DUF2079 domain-containing protein [Bacteroidia bacterium]
MKIPSLRKTGTLIRLPTSASYVVPLILLFFGALYFLIPALNHYFFRSYCYDYAVYNQAFYDYAHFRINANTVIDPPLNNFMQIHVSFLLMVLSPLYWIFNWIAGTYTLLLIQAILITAGGYAVYLLIKEQTEDKWLSILALLHYFLLQGHFSALAADYIDTTVGASLVPVYLLFFFRKRVFPALIFFILVIITKENFALWLIFISLTVLILKRTDRFFIRWSGFFLAVSCCYLIIIYPWLVKYFEDPQRPYWGFSYSALGKNLSEAFYYVLSHPVKAIELLFFNHTGEPENDFVKAEFYIVTLLSGGVLILRKPILLIPLIPIIAQKMYNDNWLRWSILSFYSVEIVSILSICVFISIAAFRQQTARRILGLLVVCSTAFVTVFKLSALENETYHPAKENIFSADFYSCNVPARHIHKALKLIPQDASVAATDRLVPHLAYRRNVHCFPYLRDSEYIAMLSKSSAYPYRPDQISEQINKLIRDPAWETIYNDDYLRIFKLKSPVTAGPVATR